MTKPRILPKGYITLIVQPNDGFLPVDWRKTPATYRIVEFVGPVATLGEADAWKFLHNQDAMKTKDYSRWAIHVSLRERELPSQLRQRMQMSSHTKRALSNCRELV